MISNITILLISALYFALDYGLCRCNFPFMKRVTIGTIWFTVFFVVIIIKYQGLLCALIVSVFSAYAISELYNIAISKPENDLNTDCSFGDKIATATDRFIFPIFTVGIISTCLILGILYVNNKTQIDFNNDINAEYADTVFIPDDSIVKAKLESVGYSNVSVYAEKGNSKCEINISATKNWQDMSRTIFVSIK